MTENINETFNQNIFVASFVNLIRYEREKANLSVRELGKKAGVSYTVIYEMENRNVLPKLETINKLAKALGFYVDIKKIDRNEQTRALSISYYKAKTEQIQLVRKSANNIDIDESQLDIILMKKGLYHKDIEEIKSFIEFKLSQHKK